MTESLNSTAKHLHVSFFFLRISSTLKTGMIKRETKAKKNIQNPLCFCGVPNIFIKVITKASLLHQNKMCSYLKKQKMKIHYSINSSYLLHESMAAQQPQNLRPYPDTSVSFIHNPERKKRKREWKKDTLQGERKSAVNHITLSIQIFSNQSETNSHKENTI